MNNESHKAKENIQYFCVTVKLKPMIDNYSLVNAAVIFLSGPEANDGVGYCCSID